MLTRSILTNGARDYLVSCLGDIYMWAVYVLAHKGGLASVSSSVTIASGCVVFMTVYSFLRNH